jgi:hypothetical protein
MFHQRTKPGVLQVNCGSSKNSFVIIGRVLQLGALHAPEQDLSFDMRVSHGEIPVAQASNAAIRVAAHLTV